jgi:hypothetical protein
VRHGLYNLGLDGIIVLCFSLHIILFCQIAKYLSSCRNALLNVPPVTGEKTGLLIPLTPEIAADQPGNHYFFFTDFRTGFRFKEVLTAAGALRAGVFRAVFSLRRARCRRGGRRTTQ